MSKKRVVSKSAYVSYLVKKTGLTSAALSLAVLGSTGFAIGMGAAVIGVFLMIGSWFFEWIDFKIGLLLIPIGLVCSGLMLWLIRVVDRIERHATELEAVVPLTQRTAEQLLAEESLVRASAEPTEPAKASLLRAVQPGGETPTEELLRSSREGKS